MTYWILTPLALLAAFGWGMQVGERRADAAWAPAVLRLLDRRFAAREDV